MGLFPVPSMDSLARAAVNVRDKAVRGHLADLRRMPRVVIDGVPMIPAWETIAERSSPKRKALGQTVYRYAAPDPSAEHGDPVLLVPPLGAPDFAFDLRRGASLVEHLVRGGRRVYLVDYGRTTFDDGRLGIEHWTDEVVPRAVDTVSADAADSTRGGARVQLVGWCLGGLFSLLTAAAHPELPIRSITAIASPFDISAVPLVAPLRPLAQVTGGRVLSSVYQALGSLPAPVVRWAFQLSSVDRYVTKPLTVLSKLDDRDFLEQIEAVDHLMANMYAYPGRAFGQIYHLMLRSNDLASGGIDLGGRRIELADVAAPVLLVAGSGDSIAPLRAVRKATELLTGAPEVRFEAAPGGHLGVLTGRQARGTTWTQLDAFLVENDGDRVAGEGAATGGAGSARRGRSASAPVTGSPAPGRAAPRRSPT